MFKIKAVLRNTEKKRWNIFQTEFRYYHRPTFLKKKNLPALMECIRDSKCALCDTRLNTKKRKTQEPWNRQVCFLAGNWYMVAFCHLRNDYRHFRLRSHSGSSTHLQPHSKNHPPIKGWMDHFSRQEKDLTKVVIDMKTSSVRFLGDQKFYSGFVEEIPMGDFTRLVFLTQSINGFARWMMMFAGSVPNH